MTVTTNVKQMKLNVVTQQQYDSMTKNANELYAVTDASISYKELSDKPAVTSLPTASISNEGDIYQYIGVTDQYYTHGYFYECVSDGAVSPTYSWEQLDVQPQGDSLPSQTGQSGKFLTTDGSSASWATISALQNTATGTDALTILGTATTQDYAINIGSNSQAQSIEDVAIGKNAQANGGNEQSVAVGSGAKATGAKSIALGSSAYAYGNASVAIGRLSQVNNSRNYSIAIGFGAQVNADRAIQIGRNGSENAVNTDANTFKVANANGNFEIMSADGTIPTARLTKINTTVTLAAASWSSNSQTVSVIGMTADGVVLVSPDPTDQSAYTSAGILCTTQNTDELMFTCDTVPSNDINVTVVML